jgi:hypothetical protein
LIVNVEEQIAKRLYDLGFPEEARRAIHAAQSLRDNTPFDELESARFVPLTSAERAQRERDADQSAWENFRLTRDGLLAASDWTQLPDVPTGKKKAWAAYRQKLRDLPTTTTPTGVEWPEPPK